MEIVIDIQFYFFNPHTFQKSTYIEFNSHLSVLFFKLSHFSHSMKAT